MDFLERRILKFARWLVAAFSVLLPGLLSAGPAVAQPSPASLPAYCAHIAPPSATLPGATTYVYRRIGTRILRVHIFAPEGTARQNPAVLFYFGGGFRLGDAASLTDLAKAFSARGYVAAIADYRVLCRDGVAAPAGVDDAEASIRWLRDHASELDIDRQRIAAGGGSAGGLLAASAAIRLPKSVRPSALILFNPVLDLETGVWAHDQSTAEARAYSPSLMPMRNLPPTIIFHGDADRTVPIQSSRDFCVRAETIGRVCQLVEYPGKDHSFASKRDVDPVLGISAFDDTSGRAWRFLQPIMRPEALRVPTRGDRYVAMGSSFAAGPGLPPEIEGNADRCNRSAANYSHLLALKLGLDLSDVSCGGATTAHILGRWNELPAQIDAVTADTRLVTVTIGGNDVGYIASLIKAASCAAIQPAPARCKQSSTTFQQAWSAVEQSMRSIVTDIRRRAPGARIVFVDYVTLLPARGTCPQFPFPAEQADTVRAIAAHLAESTARVATSEGVEVVRASWLSRRHDACSKAPWANGWIDPLPGAGGVRFHPNAAGMAAVADALEKLLVN